MMSWLTSKNRECRRCCSASEKPRQLARLVRACTARLMPDDQNNPKTRLAAHHSVVSFCDTLQWEGLIHRPHAGARTECDRVLRADRWPGIPALDRPAPHYQ